MAAAVEATPRRVRALLSSFLHSSGKDDKLGNQPDDVSTESICRSQPKSKEAFWSRVETFTPFTWFAKPQTLSPLHCAQYGWENSEADMLQCVSCKACLDASTSTTWDPDMYTKTCDQLKEALVSGHSKLCPWPDNPCPECFIKLPMYSYAQWLEDYKARWRTIVTLVDEIPLVDPQAIQDMDGLTEGHIKGLQNLVDPGSVCWTSNELDLEKASQASCIIALCGWEGRSGIDPDIHTINCSLCRRELGVWNFYPLTHDPIAEQTDHEAPSYLDTGQMWSESETSVQEIMQEQTSETDNEPSEQQQVLNLAHNSAQGEGNVPQTDKNDKTEPMEETRAVERASSHSSMEECEWVGEEDISDREGDRIRTFHKSSRTVLMSEPLGLKSPLHRSLLDIAGGETTESLCVEVEDESLSERLQAVESELEFLGCYRDNTLSTGREDIGHKAKRRRVQEVEKTLFHVISEHRTWCPWIVTMTGVGGSTIPAGWKVLLGMLLPSMSPAATTHRIHETSPQEAWKTVRKLLSDCYSAARPASLDSNQ